MKNREIRAILN